MKSNPTTLAYKYILMCQGDVAYDGHQLKAVGITLAVKLYRYGNIIPVKLEPVYKGHLLNEIFDVSVNKFESYKIEKNKFMERIFRDIFKFDESRFEEIDYTAEFLVDETVNNESQTIPTQKVESVKISKDEFVSLLKNNMDSFLLKENKRATVEKVSLIGLEQVV